MSKGRPPDLEDSELIEIVSQYPQGSVYPSTATIRDELDGEYNRKTVYRRLSTLVENRVLDKIEVGKGRGNTVGWMVNGSEKPGPDPIDSKIAVLETLESENEKPALTAGDLTKMVDYSRKTVHKRLNELVDEKERVKSEQIGGRTAYWVDDEND